MPDNKHTYLNKKIPGRFDSQGFGKINQFIFYQPSIAACAAARRAIGTRNGEQLT